MEDDTIYKMMDEIRAKGWQGQDKPDNVPAGKWWCHWRKGDITIVGLGNSAHESIKDAYRQIVRLDD